MKLTPISDYVVVFLNNNPYHTSPLVMPDSVKSQKTNHGVVEAVGPGKLLKDGTRRPMNVRPGDNVIVELWKGKQIVFEGHHLLLIPEKNVIGMFYDDAGADIRIMKVEK